MPIDERTESLDELRGLVTRLRDASSITVRDVERMAVLAGNLDYSLESTMIRQYYAAGQIANVVACAGSVLDKAYGDANPGPPKRLIQ